MLFRSRNNGLKGGRKKTQDNPKNPVGFQEPKKADKDIDKDKDKEKEIVKETDIEKRKKFIKPTLEELKEYISTREIKIDAQKFLNHYDSVGWKVSNNPMKDWKACVRTWEGRNYNTTNNQQKPTGMPKPNYNDPNYYKDDGGFYD